LWIAKQIEGIGLLIRLSYQLRSNRSPPQLSGEKKKKKKLKKKMKAKNLSENLFYKQVNLFVDS
jgi:hypothetical protein